MRPAERGLLLGLALGALLPVAASAQAPSPRGEQRRKLLDQLGLEKKPAAPRPAPEQTEESAPASPTDAPAPPAGATAEAPSAPAVVPFRGRVHELLLASCRACHAAGASAGGTGYVLDGNVGRDHAASRRFVDLAAPARSRLVTKAIGQQHGGGASLRPGGPEHRRLREWIATGAHLAEPAPPGASAAATPAQAAPAPDARPRTPARRPTAPAAAQSGAPAAASPSDETAPAVASETPEAPPTTAGPPPGEGGPAAPAAPPPPPPPPIASRAHEELRRGCQACHGRGGSAAGTRWVLTGDRARDLTASRTFADLGRPEASPLLTKALGRQHGPGAIWRPGSPSAETLLAWLRAGAPTADPVAPAPAVATAAPPPAGADPSPEPPVADTAAAPIPPPPDVVSAPSPRLPGDAPAAARPPAGLALGYGLTLNGRFDLNLERRTFETDPFARGATTALRSYHHFLFLSRQSADDPVAFTVELVGLTFYEGSVRLTRPGAATRAHLRAGKLLVPFGAEPLFHQNYGGHLGFDQRVLPAVWASEGAALSFGGRAAGFTLDADVFGVVGHRLRRPDAILNLQSDRAPLDEARIATGARLAVGRGALAAFYSSYFNPLGHGRRLFMQALDVGLWRARRVPVLDRLVLAGGVLRADVSGGGPGQDHYHFASYWLARVYLPPFLILQYRQGLRTFDNRRGLYRDARRYDGADGSTHNVTLFARWHGLLASVAYQINLEKRDERPDDLLRFTVAYEF
jgi:hypothetical protein